MTRLVEDLLTLARLDEQRPLEHAPVDLLILAMDSMMDASVNAPDRRVTLVGPDDDRAAPAPILGDENRMRQVVVNLMANALRYTPAGTPIEIAVGTVDHLGGQAGADGAGRSSVIEIRDHGPGVSEEDRARIFERFYREDKARSRARGGSGLGLAIVRRIADMLGHPVAVRSTIGKGSVFSVTVPLAVPEQRHAGDHAGSSPSGRSGHPKCRPVLLVEDDPAVLGAMVMLLEEWGLSVVTASSLQELKSRIQESAKPASLIIADYRLADGNTGPEAIDAIREISDPRIPGIVLTGDTAPGLLERVGKRGFGILHKPVAADDLHRIVLGYIDCGGVEVRGIGLSGSARQMPTSTAALTM